MTADETSTLTSPVPALPAQENQPLVVESAQLFKNQKTVRIAHEGQFYLLRITRENKLILTK